MQKFNQKQSVTKEPRKPISLFCEKDHWGDTCTEYDTLEKRKNYFVEHKLCLTVERKATWQTSAVVEVVINARPSIIPVCVMINL